MHISKEKLLNNPIDISKYLEIWPQDFSTILCSHDDSLSPKEIRLSTYVVD